MVAFNRTVTETVPITIESFLAPASRQRLYQLRVVGGVIIAVFNGAPGKLSKLNDNKSINGRPSQSSGVIHQNQV
jgi:hypothetical protein